MTLIVVKYSLRLAPHSLIAQLLIPEGGQDVEEHLAQKNILPIGSAGSQTLDPSASLTPRATSASAMVRNTPTCSVRAGGLLACRELDDTPAALKLLFLVLNRSGKHGLSTLS